MNKHISFNRNEQRLWTLFYEHGPFSDRRNGLSAPKPDWAAYFPIYDNSNPEGTRIVTQWNWAASAGLGIADAFSHEQLQSLADGGLQCHVAARLGKHRRSKPDPCDMFTFPWLVVEHKKNQKGINDKECYEQAANAASCVLLMFENLAQYAKPERYAAHIPPVVTITTVGKEVKMWIGYAKPVEHHEYYSHVRLTAAFMP